ncbi:hypothetical protein [Bacillus sp. RS11]|uniref:hypothetical protein n=1 Tax=Lysinibacillus sp. RS11 TaxID=3242682 RepID=UPI0035C6CFA4
MEWRLGDSSGISDKGTKVKSITSCDNAFVTNILLVQAAHRTPPGSFALCESATTATLFFLCESVATATNVLSVRKRSDSNIVFSVRKCNDSNNKAPSRNGNQTLFCQRAILYLIPLILLTQ